MILHAHALYDMTLRTHAPYDIECLPSHPPQIGNVISLTLGFTHFVVDNMYHV